MADYLTVTQAAERMNLGDSTIRDACRPGGGLASFRFGRGRGAIRISPADLEAWALSRRVEGVAETGKSPTQKIDPELLAEARSHGLI